LRANGDQSAFVCQPKRNEGVAGIDLWCIQNLKNLW
jgi:hypothetical protein